MLSLLEPIMGRFPRFEVLVRHLYWRSPVIVRWYNRRGKKTAPDKSPATSSARFIRHLESCGIGDGNLIIVHSRYRSLTSSNETPSQIIADLLSLIGHDGTLAMPAIPKFDEAPEITKRMTADVSNLTAYYDPKMTPSSTGVLPNVLMKWDGSFRSSHPLNSMVAVGPKAEAMMRHNLKGYAPLPCGLNSSWYYCYQNDAKIIAVGVDLAHSLTMIHVAEDVLEDAWVVPNWYRMRRFIINIGNQDVTVTVRERHPMWAMYYAERKLSRDLIKAGITTKTRIDDVNIEICSAQALVSFLNSRNGNGYPYYMVPKRRP